MQAVIHKQAKNPEQIQRGKTIVYFSLRQFPSRMADAVHVMKMCETLQKLGNRVILIAGLDGVPEDFFKFYGVRDRFVIKDIGTPKNRFKVLRMIGWFLYLLKAKRYIGKKKPDLIYLRDYFSGYFFDVLNIPMVYEAHEGPLDFFRNFFFKKTLKSKNLRWLITISRSLKEILIKTYGNVIGDRDILAVHDGVDIDTFLRSSSSDELKEKMGLSRDNYLVGYTGSLTQGRGIQIILGMARHWKELQFIIIGGYDHEIKAIKNEIKRLELANVTILGYLAHHLIPNYLSAFDILVMPYQYKVTLKGNKRDTAKYMSPMKLFEYMASGTPIVSSDLAVIREVLEDNQNALLVKPDDVVAWCSAVDRLRRESNLGVRLSAKAKRDVEQYTWDERVKRILHFLES